MQHELTHRLTCLGASASGLNLAPQPMNTGRKRGGHKGKKNDEKGKAKANESNDGKDVAVQGDEDGINTSIQGGNETGDTNEMEIVVQESTEGDSGITEDSTEGGIQMKGG